MGNSLQSTGENFNKIHDNYLTEWENAMKTSDTTKLEKLMPSDYYVTFFIRKQDKPTFFNRTEAVDGMREWVSSHETERKRFENRVIRLKDNQNAIVFYEQIIEQDGEELARLFTIENWRIKNEQWELFREVQEHI